MSKKLKEAFSKKALITFLTGGDPDIETTEKLIAAMAEGGSDIIELGIPFSDPVAEGPVIQSAHLRAFESGCTTDMLFDMVKRLRDNNVNVPLVFLTYSNPVFVYGKEKFMSKCKDCGIDGIIVPDLPFEEKDEFKSECEKFNIDLISLIAPTSGDRAEKIAADSEGFLYCVSSLGVTGTRSEIKNDIAVLIDRVKKIKDIPCAIGFGISTPAQAAEMAKFADGVIIGSAIVEIIAEHGKNSTGPVKTFIKDVKSVI
ncbi:MAG: tryptophan synthase subunit alpha [Eubacterium sp.]|jgi:tryptophan synthase alpha chain|nr:tryptophan synthase subunit alpha [Eubacterium sp.]